MKVPSWYDRCKYSAAMQCGSTIQCSNKASNPGKTTGGGHLTAREYHFFFYGFVISPRAKEDVWKGTIGSTRQRQVEL